MKKRNLSTLLCMISCVGLLAGCGGEYAGLTEGDAVSGSAVSGEAVSGDAIQEKTVSGPAVKDGKDGTSDKKAGQDMSSYRCCTGTSLYYVSEDGEKIMQARTDGTHRKCIKEWPAKMDEENWVELLYADENWLYYDVTFDYEEDITYRAPIEKDAQGYDVVKISEAEEILRGEDLDPVYADSDYCFYIDGEHHENQIVKYDLKRKKKVSEKEEIVWDIFRIKNYYVMMTGSEKIYIQNIDSAQWKEVSAYAGDFVVDALEDIVTNNAEAVFYCQHVTKKEDDRRFHIKRHDGKQEKDFVTWEQLDHAVKEAAGEEKLDVCMPDELFWLEGRLYIQMQTGWIKNGTYHMEYMIFSQGENEDGSGSGLRYEKKLTERMKSYVKERTGKWTDGWKQNGTVTVFIEHMVVNAAQCIAMVEGKAYLSLYDYEKNQGRLACYDLDTGKFEWIGRQDAAFYKLGYDGVDPYSVFGAVFRESGNDFADAWYWPPSKDEHYDGSFKEDKKR